jgi:hypothetical protein
LLFWADVTVVAADGTFVPSGIRVFCVVPGEGTQGVIYQAFRWAVLLLHAAFKLLLVVGASI